MSDNSEQRACALPEHHCQQHSSNERVKQCKKRKKSRFLDLQINEKNVVSNYAQRASSENFITKTALHLDNAFVFLL